MVASYGIAFAENLSGNPISKKYKRLVQIIMCRYSGVAIQFSSLVGVVSRLGIAAALSTQIDNASRYRSSSLTDSSP